MGGAIGSAIGGQFQDAITEEVPEVTAPPAVDNTNAAEQEAVRQQEIVANQERERERQEDTHRTAAYSPGQASGSSASSGGRGGRRGSSQPDHGNREGSGTGGQARSGEYVSSSHDWSRPEPERESGGGGGGGGGGK